MGMRLSTMLATVTESAVKFDGEQVAFAYRPNAVTLDLTDQIDAAGKAAELAEKAGEEVEHDWITSQLLSVLEWWDVLDDKDKRIEPTRENMRRMPVTFLLAVLTQINDDQKVDEGEGEGSDVG